MVKEPQTKMQQIAAEMLKAAGLNIEYGEQSFVSTATPFVENLVIESYTEAGKQLPARRTIANWLYNSKAPDLATVLVTKCWNERKKLGTNPNQNFLT